MKNNDLFSQDWYDFVHAKKIGEKYPEVLSVHIRIEKTWASKDVMTKNLRPDDPVHLSVDCLNPECTSKFVLTDILEEALRTGTPKKGTLPCRGNETSKLGAYSCSCMLGYSIEPIIKE